MAKRKDGIIGIFGYLDDVRKAMERVKSRDDFRHHEVYTPTSYHELIHFAEERYGPSPVRWFTLVGALTGVFTGFGMTLWMDYDWPIVVGGKTPGLPSLPAYVIIGFELMVLFGAIATIIGMLVMGRIPNPKASALDVRTTDDRFGIFVPGADLSGDQARFLKECGALEVIRTH